MFAELNAHARVVRTYLDLRRWLAMTLALGAACCLLLQRLFRSGHALAPHAVYVWLAVVATLATGQFWLLMAEFFTVSDAKRYFAPISAGGTLGAAVGGGLARIASEREGTLWLLTLGAALIAIGALAALAVRDAAGGRRPVVQPSATTSKAGRDSAMRDLRGQRYLRRLLGLTLLSAMIATLIDYSFKGAVSRAVEPSQLQHRLRHRVGPAGHAGREIAASREPLRRLDCLRRRDRGPRAPARSMPTRQPPRAGPSSSASSQRAKLIHELQPVLRRPPGALIDRADRSSRCNRTTDFESSKQSCHPAAVCGGSSRELTFGHTRKPKET